MRKRPFLLIVLAFLCVGLFAAEIDSVSKIITAYKRKVNENIPSGEARFRVLNSDMNEIVAGDTIALPINSRSSSYSAFSWVFSGNVFGEMTVEFTFDPMWYENDEETEEYLPYSVSLKHSSSRIGNVTIRTNEVSQASGYNETGFSTYNFKYADKCTFDKTAANVTNESQTITATYNMQTFTKVFNKNGGDATATYPYSVCDHWNRYGAASVVIDINPDGSNKNQNGPVYENGTYYANVTVAISVSN